jgi:hypothetical protein
MFYNRAYNAHKNQNVIESYSLCNFKLTHNHILHTILKTNLVIYVAHT